MGSKVKKFPISLSQKKENILERLIVECQVSGRYLKFHKKSSNFRTGEFITIDVMAMQIEDNKPSRKICELIVTREDLLEALKHVTP